MTADSLAEAAALRTAEPRRLPRVGREPAFLHSRGVGAHGPGRLWPSSGGSLRLASFCLETRLHFVSFQAALSVMSVSLCSGYFCPSGRGFTWHGSGQKSRACSPRLLSLEFITECAHILGTLRSP